MTSGELFRQWAKLGPSITKASLAAWLRYRERLTAESRRGPTDEEEDDE